MNKELKEEIASKPASHPARKIACYETTLRLENTQEQLFDLEEEMRKSEEPMSVEDGNEKVNLERHLKKELDDYEKLGCNNVYIGDVIQRKPYYEMHKQVNKSFGITIVLVLIGCALLFFLLAYFGYETFLIIEQPYYQYDIIGFLSLIGFVFFMVLVIVYTRKE